jgi:bifunctional non-homologous end joining protein LigD
VFDLLHLDGEDLTGRPLIERKATLKNLLGLAHAASGPIRLSEHFDEDGALVYGQACRMRLEGIVSKRKDAPYRSGRTDAFVKIKCSNAQELVVVGYAPSNAMSNAIGALIVGYHESGKLRYAGRVGTGYTQKVARDLWKRLHPLELAKPPFDKPPLQERRSNARWVRPDTVIEAHFGGWTSDGLVRQGAFKGVREDKPASEVVREVPVMASKGRPTAKTSVLRKSGAKQASSADNSSVRFTHPDRVYWSDVGITKQDLADYYRTVWDFMAPHVVGRVLSLVRCPEGTKGECFFQKHAHAGMDIKQLHMLKDHKGKQIISIDSLDGLLSLVQAGVLEVHVRGSRVDHLDKCDLLIFDLDPGEDVAWRDVVAAARDVRECLAGLKLKSFVKLSGGKGLHVAVPIETVDWDTAKDFAHAVAARMALDDPKRYVAKMTKSLRAGRIFIDYLRNSEEATSVAAYSTRARDGAPVSMPVSWDELGRTKSANQYTVLNIKRRIGALKADPWKDISRVRQKLPDLKKLSRAA